MVDHLELTFIGGKGGAGAVSFLRQKYRPKGPPDGGDGGDGGSVYLEGDNGKLTLYDLSSKKLYKADDGVRGSNSNKHGKNGSDLVLKVPLGTIVSFKDGSLLGDITQHGDQLLIAKGGGGGRGNARFKSSQNRSPKKAEEGKQGENVLINLDLKIIADIGLIGLPNAGKSTLLNALSNASSKIGSHPFTTLEPQLGVIEGEPSLVVADIPGLIEGASKGKGLGDKFLRHVERTKVLVHLIDASHTTDPVRDYTQIRGELKAFNPKLVDKKELILITKFDIDPKRAQEAKNQLMKVAKEEPILISAVNKMNLNELKERLRSLCSSKKNKEKAKKSEVRRFSINDLPNKRIVFR